MPAIIFEGPDESGKTTAAKQLIRSLLLDKEQYVHSPVKEREWQDDYKQWALDFAWDDDLWILDRTPEVSEHAYSIMPGRESRVPNIARTLKSWEQVKHRLILIVCQGYPLQASQVTAEGHTIHRNSEYEQEIILWYETFYKLRMIHYQETGVMTLGYDKDPEKYHTQKLETEHLLPKFLMNAHPKGRERYAELVRRATVKNYSILSSSIGSSWFGESEGENSVRA